MKHPPPPPAPRAALVLASLLAACATARLEKDVSQLAGSGRYDEAVRRAEELVAARPADARTRALLRDAQVARLLDRGRSAVFDGANEEALEIFEEARRLAPGVPVVADWIEKTRLELANEWLLVAQEISVEDFGPAYTAYERVLQHDPDSARAILGLARVALLQNYRAGRSHSYYREGIEAFESLLLEPAQRPDAFETELEEDPAARERFLAARQDLAEERLALAEKFEDQGLLQAAWLEYRLAELLAASGLRARQGHERMFQALLERGDVEDAFRVPEPGS